MAGLTLQLSPEEVVYVNISTSKSGYNYATVGVRRGQDDDYISLSYEWRGKKVPDTVMDMMSFIKENDAMITANLEANKEIASKFERKPVEEEN